MGLFVSFLFFPFLFVFFSVFLLFSRRKKRLEIQPSILFFYSPCPVLYPYISIVLKRKTMYIRAMETSIINRLTYTKASDGQHETNGEKKYAFAQDGKRLMARWAKAGSARQGESIVYMGKKSMQWIMEKHIQGRSTGRREQYEQVANETQKGNRFVWESIERQGERKSYPS